jgi:hypothetical protein
MNPINPSPALLCKLGSIAVHVEELLSANGHALDRTALLSLLSDDEVREWLTSMDDMAMLPKKR